MARQPVLSRSYSSSLIAQGSINSVLLLGHWRLSVGSCFGGAGTPQLSPGGCHDMLVTCSDGHPRVRAAVVPVALSRHVVAPVLPYRARRRPDLRRPAAFRQRGGCHP